MDEQSKTTGGRIERLGDSWEQLQVQIGRSQVGIIKGSVDWAESIVSHFESVFRAQNELQDSFSKFKAPEVTFLEERGFVAGRDATQLENLRSGVIAKNERTEKKGIAALKERRKLLQDENLLLSKRFLSEEKQRKSLDKDKGFLAKVFGTEEGKDLLDPKVFLRDRAINKTAIDDIGGRIRTLEGKIEADKKKVDAATLKAEKLGTGVGISGRRPQNINIEIGKLIETQNITTNTLEESTDEIRESVAKVLLEAVNDINSVAR
jgi:hypothetical protein